MENVGYYVLRALEEKIYYEFDDEALQSHIDWVNKHSSLTNAEEEKRGYEIVLGGDYKEYLTTEYKGHKVVYVAQDCLEIDGRKIKIVTDSEFVYKVQKTHVKAINGAIGLMARCFVREFDWQVWGSDLCDVINKKTKEIKC